MLLGGEGKERNGKNGGASIIFDMFQLLIIKYNIKCFLYQMLLPQDSTFKHKRFVGFIAMSN